ncbi:MAG: YbaB/EbfC family nucleoid-associated protein [Christensenellaceae bacterium]|nr:YbaB/EbfC family nucleoid-associated protein [Christensenellaceae bacterium]
MQNLLRQAQKMQDEMLKAEQSLSEKQVTSSTGGGMVELVMTCDHKLISLKIKPEAVDPDDVEMLEDTIIAAFNEASNLIEATRKEVMGPFSAITNGLF